MKDQKAAVSNANNSAVLQVSDLQKYTYRVTREKNLVMYIPKNVRLFL